MVAVSDDDAEAVIQMCVDVQKYNPDNGAVSWWDDEAICRAEVERSPASVVISGNRRGLISLARHLLTLAQEDVPGGNHMDFDEYCGFLDEGSLALRFEVDRSG